MTFSFQPKKLIQEREQICKDHPFEEDTLEIEINDDLKKLIFTIVGLELYQVKPFSMAMSEKDVLRVIGYLPHDYYNVDLKNLFLVFGYRTSKKGCALLYKEWQNRYDNKICNSFMVQQLSTNEDLILLTRDLKYGETFFEELLKSDSIPIKIGNICLSYSFPDNYSLAEKLSIFQIEPDSVLFHDIEFLFYTYCSKSDYINASIVSLQKTIEKYKDKYLKAFLVNFLGKLSLRELDQFVSIGRYLDGRLGDAESSNCKAFFSALPPGICEKYHNWIIRIKINEVFGNDERSIFWRKYRFVSRPQRYMYSNSVSMEFEDYIVVEFLGKAMGPMYFYEKAIFYNHIQRYMTRSTNSDLRQTLLHTHLFDERIEHRGEWQYKTDRMLISRHITERLNENYI